MKTLSDASQIAALDAAIRCINGQTSPTRRERDLLTEQLGVVRQRIVRAKERAEAAGGQK